METEETDRDRQNREEKGERGKRRAGTMREGGAHRLAKTTKNFGRYQLWFQYRDYLPHLPLNSPSTGMWKVRRQTNEDVGGEG